MTKITNDSYTLLNSTSYGNKVENTGTQSKTSNAKTSNEQHAYLGNDIAAVYTKSSAVSYTSATYTKAVASKANKTLKVGSRGEEVKTLQKNLKTLGYLSGTADGIFGNNTKNAVVAFQKANGLTADGIVGTATQNAITKALELHYKKVLRYGSRGEEVKELQQNLKTLGYLSDTPDGIFGNNTKNAVMTFQRENGLSVDGVVGSDTKKAIEAALEARLPQFQGHVDLGYLSAKFESAEDCGTISSLDGDKGGKSYGLYQFSSEANIPKYFVAWLEDRNYDMYQKLNNAYIKDGGYGSNFDTAWKSIAATNNDAFSEYQYQYTKEKYYDTSVRKIKENLGFDVEDRSYALKSVIWSRGVQMNECAIIFGKAVAGMDLSKATDEEIIKAIYDENAKLSSTPPKETSIRISAADGDEYGITGRYLYYFSTNGSDVQAGVYNRLTNTERNEALRLLEVYG